MKIYNNSYVSSTYFNQTKPKFNIDRKSGSAALNGMQNFKGHTGYEDFSKNAIGKLIHETAFFREPATDEFLKLFILNKWKDKDKIKIICGACSTGEEAITLSMLLDKIKDKVSILGMDLSEKSIEEANSRQYSLEYYPNRNTSADFDSYLWHNKVETTINKYAEYKTLFHKFFKPVFDEEQEKANTKDSTVLKKFFYKINDLLNPDKFTNIWTTNECKYKLRDGKAQNVKFLQGDINNIDIITSKEKADIITFRNALYHLLNGEKNNKRYLLGDADIILDNLIKKFRKSLTPDGLIVFGSQEHLQIKDSSIINEVLSDNRFEPLNAIMGNATIWQKLD